VKPTHSRTLVVAGLVLMVAGALDPLEGSVIVLGGSALAAAGTFFARTRRYRLQLSACVLVALGVGALFGLSALGGVGGNTGRSIWWLRSACPIPSGG
jgi:4-hydroxybenzoate polyprenyltransferase